MTRFAKSADEVEFQAMVEQAKLALREHRPAMIHTTARWVSRAIAHYTPEVEMNALIFEIGAQFTRFRIADSQYVFTKNGPEFHATLHNMEPKLN